MLESSKLTASMRNTLESRLAEYVDSTNGTIHPAIYTDPNLHDLEQERIFGRCWIMVAHESLIPNPGDFFASQMGEDPVLVVRQKNGDIEVFLNQCRHRGARLCRADLGTTRAFQCPYHGWTYDTAGNLISVSKSDVVGGEKVDKSEWGAVKVAKLHNYHGLLFATWDKNAPDFEDYLGPAKWYFDAIFNRPGGTEVIGGVQKWVVPANWKFAAEQFTSDIYHFDYTHISSLIAMMPEDIQMNDPPPVEGRQFRGNGHGGTATSDVQFADMQTALAMGPEVLGYLLSRRDEHAELVGELAAKGTQFVHANIFPTLGILPLNQTLRVWQPKGPDHMEVWAWTLVDKDAPDSVKDTMRVRTQMSFATSGIFEQDDAENWAEIQRALRGPKSRTTLFNNQLGQGEDVDASGTYPGESDQPVSESASRGFYAQWRTLMQTPVSEGA